MLDFKEKHPRFWQPSAEVFSVQTELATSEMRNPRFLCAVLQLRQGAHMVTGSNGAKLSTFSILQTLVNQGILKQFELLQAL